VRLRVMVREGDGVTVGYTFGRQVGDEMVRTPEFSASEDKVARWRHVHGSVFVNTAQVSASGTTTIKELTRLALTAARDQGRAHPADRPPSQTATLWDIWLADPFTFGRLPDERTVEQLDLHDGDVLVLCIQWDLHMSYYLLPSPDPEHLFANLLLGTTAFSRGPSPRLWGALLYTDADAELAGYVRTHFDELNALTGPVLRIFVIERPAEWSTALRYWRQHLEKPLLRVFATMQWLRWIPFDKHRCHDIARTLGISPDALPCLVLFRGADASKKLVFPIESVSPAYLRALFGAISDAAGSQPGAYQLAEAYDKTRGLRNFLSLIRHKIVDRPDGAVLAEEPDQALQQVLKALPRTPAPRAELGHDAELIDWAAYARVAAAEQRIREAAALALPPPGQPVVVLNTGSSMSETFHFHGPTTFVNRPVDTVIRDFQNSYGSAGSAGSVGDLAQLTELLRLVLTSAALSEQDRERAATAVHEAAGELAAPEPARSGVLAKLKVVADVVGRASDIVAPATEIIKNLTQM
jgi:hypothetical protein